jgi:hypothetical protein
VLEFFVVKPGIAAASPAETMKALTLFTVLVACTVGEPQPPKLDNAPFATPGEGQLTRDWVVYSPATIYQGGQFVTYYGGWGPEQLTAFQAGTWPRDAIYRSVCASSTSCPNEQKVIDSVFWGFRDAQGNVLSEINDPSIILMPAGYYIMYMTGLDLPWSPSAPIANAQASNNHVYFATSYDGVNWSQPSRLLPAQWLPSATITRTGEVYVYVNSNVDGLVRVKNMGTSGVAPQSTQVVRTTDAAGNVLNYINVHVQWVPAINAFQMVAQRNNYDDYLYSYDGVNFTMQFAGIAQSNQGHPSALPGNFCRIYYGNNGNVFWDDWCGRCF